MPIDLSAYSAPSRSFDRQGRDGFLSTAGDFALDVLGSPVRAAEGIFDSVYGLADTLTFGALPEFFEKGAFSRATVGDARTIGGGILDTALQFVVPFNAALKGLQGAKYIGAAAQAALVSRGANVAAKATGLARVATAGAIVDATIFDGNSGRLSDLVQSNGFTGDALANPLSAWLATAEDDSELEGRLKNAIEGLALGSLTDGLFTIFRGYKLNKYKGRSAADAKKWNDFVSDARELGKISDSIEEHTTFDRWGARKEVNDARREAFDGGYPAQTRGQVLSEIENRVGLTKSPYLSIQGEVINSFLERFTPVLDSIRVEFTQGRGERSLVDFTEKVVRVSLDAAEKGKLDREFVHEFYHVLQSFVSKKTKAKLVKGYQTARDQALAADPDLARRLESGNMLETDYRFLNEDEWFAELATERTVTELRDQLLKGADPEAESFIKKARYAFQGVLDVFRGFYGEDVIQTAMSELRQSKRLEGDVLPLNPEVRVAFSKADDGAPQPILGFSQEQLDAVVKDPIEVALRDAEGNFVNRNARNADGSFVIPEGQREAQAFNFPYIKAEVSDGAQLSQFVRQGILNARDAAVKSGDEVKIKAFDEWEAQAADLVARATGFDRERLTAVTMARIGKRISAGADVVRQVRAEITAGATMLANAGQRMVDYIKAARYAAGQTQDLVTLARYAHDFQAVGNLARDITGAKSASGQLQVSFKARIRSFDELQKRRAARNPDLPLDQTKPAKDAAAKPKADAEAKPKPDAEAKPAAEAEAPKKPVLNDPNSDQALAQWVESMGGRKALEKLWDEHASILKMYGEDAYQQLVGTIKRGVQVQKSRSFSRLRDYFFFSLLSHPATLTANMLGNGLNTVFQPFLQGMGAANMKALSVANRIVGNAAAAQKFSQAGSDAAVHMLAYMSGMMQGFAESVGQAARAYRTGAPVFAQRSTLEASRGQLGRKQIPRATHESAALNMISTFFRSLREDPLSVPGRALVATDELFTHANARGMIYADAYLNVTRQGIEGKDLAAIGNEAVRTTIVDGHAATKEGLVKLEVERLTEAARSTGAIPDEDLIVEQAAINADKYLDENPQALASAQRAQEIAQRIGFTNPQDQDTVLGQAGSLLQTFTTRFPVFQFLFPFVNTPVNLLNTALDYSVGPQQMVRLGQMMAETFPAIGRQLDNRAVAQRFGFGDVPQLRELRKIQAGQFRGLVSQDPAIVAREMGKLSTAVGFMTLFGWMVSTDRVTGALPKNKADREAALLAGYRPYSFKFGNEYVSYARLDPFASVIGLIADVGEYMKRENDPATSVTQDAAVGIATALGNMLTEKSYLQGFSNIVEGLQDESAMRKLVEAPAVALAAPGIVKATRDLLAAPSDDRPELRELRGFVDKVWDRFPDLGIGLIPQPGVRRNFLGEVQPRTGNATDQWLKSFSPLAFSTVEGDLISKEIELIGHAFTPPPDLRAGVSLHDIRVGDTTAYDRWGELVGKVRINGRTIRQALNKAIRSASYQRMTPESTFTVDSPRIQVLRSVVEQYRIVAYRQLLSESPELSYAERQFANRKRLAEAGIALN